MILQENGVSLNFLNDIKSRQLAQYWWAKIQGLAMQFQVPTVTGRNTGWQPKIRISHMHAWNALSMQFHSIYSEYIH